MYICSPSLRLIAYQISFHLLLLFSLQGYMQESAYIASQGMYTRAWLGTRIQTCPPMYIISIQSSVVAMDSHTSTFTLNSHVPSIYYETT